MNRNGRVKMAADHNGPTGFRLAHELEGLLRGISADGTIDSSETERLRRWLAHSDEYRNVIPFAELHRQVERALADGTLAVEEVEDLLFVVSKLTTVNPYFDQLRSGIQVLMGVLAGVAADQELEDSEADALVEWTDDWMHLRGLWPYDEIEAIVTTIVARNRVAEDGRRLLMLAESFPRPGSPSDVRTPRFRYSSLAFASWIQRSFLKTEASRLPVSLASVSGASSKGMSSAAEGGF